MGDTVDISCRTVKNTSSFTDEVIEAVNVPSVIHVHIQHVIHRDLPGNFHIIEADCDNDVCVDDAIDDIAS